MSDAFPPPPLSGPWLLPTRCYDATENPGWDPESPERFLVWWSPMRPYPPPSACAEHLRPNPEHPK